MGGELPLPRLAHIFVVVCFLIASTSLAIVLYAAYGMALLPAGVIGAAAFVLAMLVRSAHAGGRYRADVAQLLDDDHEAIAALVGRAEQAETRLKAMEARLARMQTDPSAAEIATLGGLVKDLADSLAEQEARLEELQAQVVRAQMEAAALRSAAEAAAASPVTARPVAAPVAGTPAITTPAVMMPEIMMAESVAQPMHARPAPPMQAPAAGSPRDMVEALEREQVETHIQAIVGLPQRKHKLYEAQAKLRLADGRLLVPAEYRAAAAAIGRLERLEVLHFQRCVQLARRLAANRGSMVLCSLSLRSLSSPSLAEEALRALAALPGLSGQIAFAFTQKAVSALTRAEQDALARLATAGYRYCLTEVTDLDFEPRALAVKGFRFVGVPAALLLRDLPGNDMPHPLGDLAGLLLRSGIDLIATEIDSEAAVIDLLDLDLRFAQGDLFGPMRQVRADLLAGEAPAAAVPAEDRGGPTLGETALQGVIEKVRQAQAEKLADQERAREQERARDRERPGGARTGWRALAKQINPRERA